MKALNRNRWNKCRKQIYASMGCGNAKNKYYLKSQDLMRQWEKIQSRHQNAKSFVHQMNRIKYIYEYMYCKTIEKEAKGIH